MAAPQWAAFVGLTGLVVTAFLVLAWLSAGAVRDPPTIDWRFTPVGVDPGVQSRPVVHTRMLHPQLESISTASLLANVAVTQGLFAVVLVGGAVAFSIPPRAFGLGAGVTSGRALLLGLALGAGLWVANEASARALDVAGIEYDERLRAMLAPDSLAGWVVLLGVALPTIAAVEELLFRAAAIGVVAAGFDLSPWPLVVGSSVAFGLGHGAQGRAGIAVTAMLGTVLASAFVLSGSLLVVVVAHYLVNALELVVHEGLA
ncbi:CPBP family intramembrane glutamic endopeptidase [Halapricum desulfuricans]|uniref:Metal-dependent membrane protease, CAAX family n=1 Tax=Halapricum desulfuricans TaxID=2841257 RepID=A0A897NU46_9EURY|nr:CPBP family intramembrane glutamic endopeptidase [Halapricum desulfuricans]QSG13676.1 Metal-dependent membrane protease, CAAX family [Halapricum desulfuricans]